jgi:hypothetical protein
VGNVGFSLTSAIGARLQERTPGADELQVNSTGAGTVPTRLRRVIPGHGDQTGLSSSAGLVGMGVSLLLVAVLLLLSLNVFSSGGAGSPAGGGASGTPSIFSRSHAEGQIKLCSEGRDSSYGHPPTPAQQAACIHDLLGQVAGGGSSVLGSP